MRTEVAIIGAGPAGLLLGQLLQVHGIANVILERRSGEYVRSRIRAGLIEEGTVGLLDRAGVGERPHREGLVHEGIEISFAGRRQRIDFRKLTGKAVTVYGQTEITRDLMDARGAADAPTFYEVDGVTLHDIASDRPRVLYRKNGTEHEIACDFIAGGRRVSRHQPADHPAGGAAQLRARLSVRLARHTQRNAASFARVDLCQPRAWVCAVLDALADPQPSLCPMPARRFDRGLVRRAVLG